MGDGGLFVSGGGLHAVQSSFRWRRGGGGGVVGLQSGRGGDGRRAGCGDQGGGGWWPAWVRWAYERSGWVGGWRGRGGGDPLLPAHPRPPATVPPPPTLQPGWLPWRNGGEHSGGHSRRHPGWGGQPGGGGRGTAALGGSGRGTAALGGDGPVKVVVGSSRNAVSAAGPAVAVSASQIVPRSSMSVVGGGEGE